MNCRIVVLDAIRISRNSTTSLMTGTTIQVCRLPALNGSKIPPSRNVVGIDNHFFLTLGRSVPPYSGVRTQVLHAAGSALAQSPEEIRRSPKNFRPETPRPYGYLKAGRLIFQAYDRFKSREAAHHGRRARTRWQRAT